MNTGRLKENQKYFLNELKLNGYKTLVSNDYDLILFELMEYFKGVRYSCAYCNCSRKYKTSTTRHKRYKYFHRIEI